MRGSPGRSIYILLKPLHIFSFRSKPTNPFDLPTPWQQQRLLLCSFGLRLAAVCRRNSQLKLEPVRFFIAHLYEVMISAHRYWQS